MISQQMNKLVHIHKYRNNN